MVNSGAGTNPAQTVGTTKASSAVFGQVPLSKLSAAGKFIFFGLVALLLYQFKPFRGPVGAVAMIILIALVLRNYATIHNQFTQIGL